MDAFKVTSKRLLVLLVLAGGLAATACISHEGPTVPKKPPEPDGGGKIVVPSRDSLRPAARVSAQSFSDRNAS
jgi:hypothetical protein